MVLYPIYVKEPYLPLHSQVSKNGPTIAIQLFTPQFTTLHTSTYASVYTQNSVTHPPMPVFIPKTQREGEMFHRVYHPLTTNSSLWVFN